MGKGTNTVVQNSQPPASVLNAYNSLISQGQQVASTPLQQYGGPMVAGFNPEQQLAFSGVNAGANAYAPYNNLAASETGLGATSIYPDVQQFSPSTVNQYYSPYQSDVVNSTLNTMNEQNAVQDNQLLGSAIASGNAFGGDRAGVAQAQLGLNQALASGQTIAGLENQGYSTALGELNTQQNLQANTMESDAWRQISAGGEYAGLGAQAQQEAIGGANAMLGVGGLEQQLQQEQLDIPYEMYQQQQAYPFQTTDFLAGITEGIGSETGGTSSTTSPGPSGLSQIAGLGIGGLGLAGDLGLLGGAGAGLGAAADIGTAADAAALTGAFGVDAGATGAATALTAAAAARRGGRIYRRADGGSTPMLTAAPPSIASWVPAAQGGLAAGSTMPRGGDPTAPQPDDWGTILQDLKDSGATGPKGWLTKLVGNPSAAQGSRRGGRLPFDDGGAVDDTTGENAAPPIGMSGTQPNIQGMLQQFGQMSTDQLQAMAVRFPAASAYGQLARRVLQQKQMTPRGNLPPQGGRPQAPSAGAPAAPQFQGLGATTAGSQSNYSTPPTALPPTTGYASGGDVGLGIPYDYADSQVSDAYGTQPGDYPPSARGPAPLPKVPTIQGPVGGQKGIQTPASRSSGIVPEEDRATRARGLGIPQPPPPQSASSPTDAGQADAGGLGADASAPADGTGAAGSDEGPMTYAADSDYSRALNPWLPVAEAGFGMMAGTSPYAGVNIGRGAMAGLEAVGKQAELKADLRYKGAQTEFEQTQADMSRLFANVQKLALEASGPIGADGGAGGTDQGTAGTGAGTAGQGQPVSIDMYKVAPEYARDMAIAQMWSLRGPAGAAAAQTWREAAVNSGDYIRAKTFIEKGASMDDSGHWVMRPEDAAALGAAENITPYTLSLPGGGSMRMVNGKPVAGSPSQIEWTGTDGKQHETYMMMSPKMFDQNGNVIPQAVQAAAEQGGADSTATPQLGAVDVARGQKFIQSNMPLFQQAEAGAKLPAGMLSAQALVESTGDPLAISPKGAEGIMQFMPQTADQYKVQPFDPKSAIPGAAKMDSDLLKKYGDPRLALAAYNWGQGNVDKVLAANGGQMDWSKVPAETQRYVLDVQSRMKQGGAGAPQQQQQPAQAGAGDANEPHYDADGNLTYVKSSPQAAAEAQETGTDLGKLPQQYRKESDDAYNMNFSINQMLNESKSWQMGKFAPLEGDLRGWLQAFYPGDPNVETPLADWTAFNKNAMGIVRMATRQLSARAAVQEMQMVQRSLPGDTMTRQGLLEIATQMKGSNDWLMARSRAAAAYKQQKGTLDGFSDDFQNKVNPAYFMLAESDQQQQKRIIDSLRTSPEGRTVLARMAAEHKYVMDNNLMPPSS